MNYNVLKDSIAAVIKANGNEEITGDLLQQVLLSMVNILGSGYQFMGAAVPTTNPGTPDARVFYIATQAGTYTNFGSPAIVLDGTQIAVLLFSTSWTSVVLSVPTKEYVDTALALKVDKVEGKGLSTNDLTDALVALIGGAFQKEDIAQDLGDSTTKVVSQAAITAVLLQYAKVDGYYSQLTAGSAENLVGRGSVPASFLRRTTGGTADVGTGSAKIAKLMGNSIVWNQLVTNPNFSSTSDWTPSRGSLSISNNIATFTKDSNTGDGVVATPCRFINGHTYYVKARIKTSINALVRLSIAGGSGSGWDVQKELISGSWTTINGLIFSAHGPYSAFYITTNSLAENDTMQIKEVRISDLTAMFGAGKEPTTAAEFEALFPLDYYAYEPGKVLPFAAQNLVTTGFNQWDEEWENGRYSSETGLPVEDSTRIRSKNAISIMPNTLYCCNIGVSAGGNFLFYDANDNFIGGHVVWDVQTFTSPSNAYYLRFYFSSTYGSTYKNDICINLSWSGYRNGEYEPYELHESMFDPANWEDADGNKIFPYGGMHGIGTARDFATPDTDGFIRKATRVIARVDLGDLTWVDSAYGPQAPVGGKLPGGGQTIPNMIMAKYIPDYNHNIDKSFSWSNSNNNIYIKDSALDGLTMEQVAAALAGTIAYFVLATPVETELAEPVAASYYANDFGTEEWQPANGAEPYTAPCDMNVAYAMNAVDTLRRLPENYISVGSFENFCTELATKLGAALNKTITITPTYDSENAEYDYAITIADIEG